MGKEYSCYYLMTELYPLDKNGLYHIINDEYEGLNKVVGRLYTEPVSENNPSRGFFGTYSYISNNVLPSNFPDIATLLQYMGYAFGVILFIAELFPRDIEYTLGRDKKGRMCFTVLDFGLTEQFDFTKNNDILVTSAKYVIDDLLTIDIYFPITRLLIDAFKVGLTDAFNVSDQIPQKRLVYREIMNRWLP